MNFEDASRYMPIHIAVQHGNGYAVEELLKHDAYVNVKGGWERKTPIEMAVENNNTTVAEILLEHGAFVTQKALDKVD